MFTLTRKYDTIADIEVIDMSRLVIIQADTAVSAVCAKLISDTCIESDREIVVFKHKFVNQVDTTKLKEDDNVIILGYSFTGSSYQRSIIDIIKDKCKEYLFLALHGKIVNGYNVEVLSNYSELLTVALKVVDTKFEDNNILSDLTLLSENNIKELSGSIYKILGCLEYTKRMGNDHKYVPIKYDDAVIKFTEVCGYDVGQWYYGNIVSPVMNMNLSETGKPVESINAFALNSDVDLNVFKLVFMSELVGKYNMVIQPKGFNVSRNTVVILVIPLESFNGAIINNESTKAIVKRLEQVGLSNSRVGRYTGYTIMNTDFTKLFS